MVTDAEVEAAAEALARYGMDEATLAAAGGKPLLSLMSAENRAGYLAKVRAGLAAAAAAAAAEKKVSPPPDSAHLPFGAPAVELIEHSGYNRLARIAQRLGARGSEEEIEAAFAEGWTPQLERTDD